MKKTILALAILFTSLIQAQTWQSVGPNISNDFYGLTFSSPSTAWAVAYNPGQIYKSTNSGNSWTIQDSIPNAFLRDIFFIDSLIGFACGLDLTFNTGTIYKTMDGGLNWNKLTIPTTISILTDIRFVNQQIGYVFGYFGRILKTTDGGNTWNTFNSPISNNIWDAELIGTDTILIGCQGLYQKIDTNAWNLVQQDLILDIDFVDDQIGFAIAAGLGRKDIYKTTDGGTSWNVVSSHNLGVSFAIPSILAIDSLTLYIAGEDRNILKTTNGGITWNPDITASSNFHIHDLIKTNNSLWAVGDSGQILKKQITVGEQEELEKTNKLVLSPNPVSDVVWLKGLENIEEIKVFDVRGKQVIKKEGATDKLDISKLKAGVYFMQVFSKEGFSSQKFIKQ